MPTLYSAQVPAGYSTSQTGGPAYDAAKRGWEDGNKAAKDRRGGDSAMPYIISASLADGFPIVGARLPSRRTCPRRLHCLLTSVRLSQGGWAPLSMCFSGSGR